MIVIEPATQHSVVYQRPERRWDLRSDEIRVCSVRLVGSSECVERFQKLLTDEEAGRAARFQTDALRNRFILGRGILRAALGQCLATEPLAIRFMYGEQGKPFLCNDRALQFNVSHSHEQGLFAISTNRELGVDIERIRELSDPEDIASRFFCFEECRDLLTLPMERRNAAFFNCWTRKEAYLKAVGRGLSVALDSFRVTLLPDEPPALTTYDANCRWVVRDISPGFDYPAALVYSGGAAVINAWQFADAAECADHLGV